MKILLIINGLFECVFGLVAIAIPSRVWEGAEPLAQSIGRAMGFACLTVAVFSFVVLKRLDSRGVVFVATVTLLFWHLGLTALQTLAAVQHLAPPPPAVIHGAFTVAFAIFLLRASPAAIAPKPTN